ncbi:MAG: hypothetical protein EA384_05025 [Spirochaetaceae bacterium]|nr:MAG: hypothetical protein EA384_05025 [Spirochaetaceae bacterium]
MNDLIQIVKEQDEWTPSPPPGLMFQLSVLTWIDRDRGSVEPWALARLAVPGLAELVRADQVRAEYRIPERRALLRRWHRKFAHSRNWADLMSRSDAELEQNGEFPDRVKFERRGKLMLLWQTEFWNMVGGPTPYHDSVALSFSSELDIRDQIEDIILCICGSLGIRQRDARPEPGA